MAECRPLTDNDSEVSGTYEVVELLSSTLPTARLRTWSFSSEEYELNRATCAKPKRKYNQNDLTWNIPDSDSDLIPVECDPPRNIRVPRVISNSKGLKVHLPSDSEDENIYDLVKSPTFSIRSAEPPLPPPLSSIPSRAEVLARSVETTEDVPEGRALKHSISISTPDRIGLVKEQHGITDQHGAMNRRGSISSQSELTETDPYDEIDAESKPRAARVGLSKPRFKIAAHRGKSKSLDDATQYDDMYAKIPKKPKWNFPSSDEDDEKLADGLSKRHLPKKFSKVMNRQDSVTSEEGERPILPPKLWEEEPGSDGEVENYERGTEWRDPEGSVTLRDNNRHRDSIVMEYNSLYCTSDSRKGSLAGSEEDDYDMLDSIDSELACRLNGRQEDHRSSAHSHSSSGKSGAEYEQTSTCIDMDQLSLDGYGTAPKRIVETHETHEIIPSESNEHDIVERIIETQTITEKLDDHTQVKDYSGEDYSKYLEDDDEFVSHIYTLGRTLEKGNANKRKSRPLDFAFVENPFLPPSPVLETMPIEKKTVKQKITTLVKKKKVQEDDGIYAEVTPNTTTVPDDDDFTEEEYENEERTDTSASIPTELKSVGNGEGNGIESTPNRGQAHNTADSLLYEAIDAPVITSKHKKANKKKKPKSDKTRSLFSGIRKLLRKQRNHSQESTDTSNSAVVIAEDDYQEFVP